MELWDAYNENEIKVGTDLIRGEKIDEGLLHAVVVIIVYHEDGTYLLMQRDWNKSKFPGLWEAGASGCVLKSESFLEAAKRELLEETGIDSENFKLIYSSINAEMNVFYKVFLCTCNIDKNNIVLQKGETIDFKWTSSKELINFIDSEYFINPSPKELKQYVISNQ
ncbi:NUDIX domain-containing protein [Clostridium chromiireducens]|uniref:NUDIX domain-containing protein n=1 Tax=Clostridium chromiireducens TaxID=225345 RepID=A0A964W5C1_9CLOT|nr:NUDIX hydrolase [Clostridium chromiireducens]MVX67299.1 NUDIX domain-containing protein [Clostridium chromiireducens]